MNWNEDARAAVAKAPFFVRGMINKRVEAYVREQGRDVVTLKDVETLRARVTGSAGPIQDEITPEQIEKIVRDHQPRAFADERAYEVRICANCPRSLFDVDALAGRLTDMIRAKGVPEAVQARVSGPILKHHKLTVSLSGCPNSCSQPQIVDFGVQGRVKPVKGPGECTLCGECVRVCGEGSIGLSGLERSESPERPGPAIDHDLCINCGDCVRACQFESLVFGEIGFSVLVGGKLGRHPQLARILFDFADEPTLLEAFDLICDIFVDELQPRERLADAVTRIGVDEIARRLS